MIFTMDKYALITYIIFICYYYMKIILFGSTGMLGRYVYSLLKTDFDIICIKRHQFDIESTDWNLLYSVLKNTVEPEDIIINCAGAIPQKNPDIRKYISLNTIFPHKLADFSKKNGNKMIHITTDCVFSGEKGNYTETDRHDAEDIYGISKSLGEPFDVCIIRTSIIGEELLGKKSLIEWVKSCKNGTIQGYNNFYWNGITCLQLAKIIRNIIKTRAYWNGVRHFFCDSIISKYQLCNMINETYELNIDIKKNMNVCKNMTLSSNYIIPTIDINAGIKEQCMYSLSLSEF